MEREAIELSVSDFVGLFNQTLDMAYPSVTIVGELANLRISRNKWIYFDLKDEAASVKFFGSVYQLPGPLEEGLLIKVRGQPRLHNLYGFSINVQSMQPTGEGSIKKAADLLKQQLDKEGLFDASRKRSLPYPPQRIGLITSKQSAAYADFIKIINSRWSGLTIELIDVQVQGEAAPQQIITAINQFNSDTRPPDVLVLIRGGGSAEDLMAFSTEEVTRAVATSRVPTLVAIGHEIDVCLSELAADQRASTPSNAAELLVPDKLSLLNQLESLSLDLTNITNSYMRAAHQNIIDLSKSIRDNFESRLKAAQNHLMASSAIVAAYNPESILKRGYAIVRASDGNVVHSAKEVEKGNLVNIKLHKGALVATVDKINSN